MTKLAGLSLLYFCIGTLFTIFFNFFGPLHYGEVTCLGLIICLFWSVIFITQNTLILNFEIYNPNRLRIFLYFLTFLIFVMSVFALVRFGPSSVIGLLFGFDTGSLLLHGLYRDQLPLRALGPPVTVVIGLFAYICFRKKILNLKNILFISLILLFFISVYETRYILIWIIIYIFGIEISKNGFAKFISLSLKNWRLFLIILLFFYIFKTFGEIRSGLGEYLDNAGPAFAEGMGVDQNYWEIGLSFLWLIIYMFSSFARGMENDPLYQMFDFVIPVKILPGFLQFLIENNKSNDGLMQDRFSTQMFAVDAWHTYATNFGFLGAVFFVNTLFMILFISSKLFNYKLSKFSAINPIYFFLILWMSTRICLFPFGDYLLDFSAFVELFFFLLTSRIARLHIFSLNRIN
jgi:hypothetical protein